jgi:hypothetical protein
VADSALTQVFAGGGDRSVGGGIGAAVAAPINAATGLGQAGMHATILGLLGFLVLMWVLIRVARFRFVITTGIGR